METVNLEEKNPVYIVNLERGIYAFIDFGCGTGGSIDVVQRGFGAEKGLGIENNKKKAIEGRRIGKDILLADATQTDIPKKKVKFCTYMDFP